MRQIRSIAFYTLLEAVRNRMVWLIGVVALIAVGLSGFVDSLAVTESRQMQAALVAALARFAAVFIVATFVVTSMAREFNDKALELLLALSLPRAAYLFGKLLGYGAIALLPAVLFGALMLLYAAPLQAAIWTVSLVCELWIVAGFGLLCILTFKNVMAALSAAMTFYLGARSVSAFVLLAQGQASEAGASQRVIGGVFDTLAAVLPRLDEFTRSDWLVHNSGSWGNLPAIVLQTLLCMALIGGVALFDLYRKNI
ncbi:ABC transporter permease [Massilia sp. CF038]|uniref:ABC transporter permease n=1 Tax=Massilia sp. CF038 TaxID=1881045 RepID=UPI001E57DA7F|nr:ABC transporter permease [Massilia sp. CF038]